MSFNKRSVIFFFLLIASSTFLVANAQEFSSTDYKISNPVIFPGGYSSSASFGLSGVVSQMATGSSTSNTYKVFSGFLYFPFVSTPVLGATPGDASVSLSWTSADSSLGWVVGGYSVGRSTVSGGLYTFSSVGNVLTSNQTGLTNGTTYYFVIKVADSLGNFIATSTQVSSTPVAVSSPTPTPSGGGGGGGGGDGGGGGGGGGGGSSPAPSVGSGSGSVNLSGRAYPKSSVTILKDAQVISSVTADSNANFQTTVTGLDSGNFIFSVYSEDDNGNRSSLLTFPVSISTGAATNIGGIFIAPTIAVDKSQVKKGDNIAIFGKTVAQSDVMIQVNSDQQLFAKAKSDGTGAYLYNFDTSPLDMGDHSTKSKTSVSGDISSYSAAAAFTVGTQNILQAKTTPTKKSAGIGDTNSDGRVNLVDYSVIAYWYKRPNPPRTADLNGDGKVTLIDFSILAYHWTG
jgi:hypothetical protein